jgi:hypothetical protein
MVIAGAAWVAFCLSAADLSSAEVTVTDPSGTSSRWSDWIEDQGPAAVVLWASWVPNAEATLNEWSAIARVARSKDLSPILVSVQESASETRAFLGDARVPWMNDRYGGLLKQFRVVEIPTMVIVDREGGVVARLDPTANALREWKSE